MTLFAACAKNEETPNTSTNTNTNTNTENKDNANTGSEEKEPAGDEGGEPAGDADDEALIPFDEEIELRVVLYDMRSTGADYGDPVEAAANAITKETLNVVCDYLWVGPGDWTSKVDVALSGGERFDVMNISPFSNVTKLYPQGLLTPITEYLEDYAAGVMEVCRDYVAAYTLDGDVYGFPTMRNFCKLGYVIMNGEVLDELGLRAQAEAMDSWSDYEAILKVVHENYTGKEGGMYPFGMGTITTTDHFAPGDSFADSYPIDNLGSAVNVIYAEQEDGIIRLLQESDAYKYSLEMNQRWYDLGYVWPDSAITTEFVDDVMKQKLIFSHMTGSETGVSVTKSAAYGYEAVCVQYCSGIIKTAMPLFTGICVPVTCEEPEAAVAWINELYTNKDLQMTMIYGVEGTDYSVVDGEVVRTNAGYLNVDFVLGNNTLLTPLQGNGADFYDIVLKTNEEAVKSNYLGYVFNTADMDLVISQISAVVDQYSKSISYGGYSEATLNEYISKLEEAGVRDYIAAAQEQLDAWMAAK